MLDLSRSLKLTAPGTLLREGLDRILSAKMGALIVVGGNLEQLNSIISGGFSLNCDFTPEAVYELAKMDGAIVISEDLKKILYANVQLSPDISISTVEPGTRHKTAERVAKQISSLVIAISERREIITLYIGNTRYVLQDIRNLLVKANQGLQVLERYRLILDQAMSNLTTLELEDSVTLFDILWSLYRIEMVVRIAQEVERYIIELGIEGRLVKMQLDELIGGVQEEEILLIKDYIGEGNSPEAVRDEIRKKNLNEILNANAIASLLNITDFTGPTDTNLRCKGYRILSYISRLPSSIIENLVSHFGCLQNILKADIPQLDEVEGIGEIRAKNIKDGLRRLREQGNRGIPPFRLGDMGRTR
ncbi:MAG TPA: DNA integrity scanning diadenylate cyclase DisA [bacterium]|nr:DNA integrity scanning diadenylate cyclase DisA [bacterium]HRU32481.1 DNA integrity scanning diadenylate cyclase DisA [bacterium]